VAFVSFVVKISVFFGCGSPALGASWSNLLFLFWFCGFAALGFLDHLKNYFEFRLSNFELVYAPTAGTLHREIRRTRHQIRQSHHPPNFFPH
jgi:hypothetical protein